MSVPPEANICRYMTQLERGSELTGDGCEKNTGADVLIDIVKETRRKRRPS
jgi:hypothetical protein